MSAIVFITSCSKSADQPVVEPVVNPTTLLLKKIKEYRPTNPANTTIEVFYTYNGNKLDKIVENTKTEKYFYTGDLITKIEFNNNSNYYITFSYLNGKLDESKTGGDTNGNNVTRKKYTYNPINNNVTYQTFTGNTISQTTPYGSGSFEYSQNGEFITYTRNELNGDVLIINRTFDDKNCPLKNVIGYEKIKKYLTINDSYPIGGFHNELTFQYQTEGYVYAYIYNTSDFPVSCIETENTGAKRNIEYTYY